MHPDNPPGSWYLVAEGETLAIIAERTGVPLEDLLEINGLRRTDKVDAGRLIYLLDANRLRATGAAADIGAAAEPARPTAGSAAPAGANAIFRWPLSAPRVTSLFGTRDGRVHEGIDLGAPIGTPILAAGEGHVIYAGDAVSGYGNMVVLEHAGAIMTVYAHNSVQLVRAGDRIASGQPIARVGQSGRATGPHLHFEVRRGQVPQDPLRFLPPIK
jgi:murein DD-endopeptidase MepM/ murein hydrolase activator NlpD